MYLYVFEILINILLIYKIEVKEICFKDVKI